ncbi:dTMP kinase [Patescibacteria group bacterium]|nr:dTMP kinase [Patescibacteria group bacterium]MBU1123234.1 dTMP kinase [Patescibacteria group bacterium]MBU1910960.1 dTMP kinase [Patescibacteria group bacterium]
MSGTFIVLEGPDGCGTTLHARLLYERLKNEGMNVVPTFEPSNGPIGNEIRDILHSHKEISPMELQQMFCDDRKWHVENVIEPALDKGKIVISDRFFCSTICYGTALGLSKDKMKDLNKDFIQPDQVFFLLPPFEVCRKRMGKRDKHDSLEDDSLQQKVYKEYQELAREHDFIKVIDSSGEKEEVASKIYEVITKMIK